MDRWTPVDYPHDPRWTTTNLRFDDAPNDVAAAFFAGAEPVLPSWADPETTKPWFAVDNRNAIARDVDGPSTVIGRITLIPAMLEGIDYGRGRYKREVGVYLEGDGTLSVEAARALAAKLNELADLVEAG